MQLYLFRVQDLLVLHQRHQRPPNQSPPSKYLILRAFLVLKFNPIIFQSLSFSSLRPQSNHRKALRQRMSRRTTVMRSRDATHWSALLTFFVLWVAGSKNLPSGFGIGFGMGKKSESVDSPGDRGVCLQLSLTCLFHHFHFISNGIFLNISFLRFSVGPSDVFGNLLVGRRPFGWNACDLLRNARPERSATDWLQLDPPALSG